MAKTTKRSYKKQNEDYWANRVKGPATGMTVARIAPQHDDQLMASFAGTNDSVAACGGVGGSNSLRNQWAPVINSNNLYPNLSAGIMPFGANNGYYTMEIPINLATLAYFNVALVRNTINMLQDFSISPLHVRTTNLTVKTFFEKWFEAINLPDFMSQFFLEYYRSGNVFIYKFNGKIEDDKFDKLKTAFAAAKSPELPIRFTILDPKQVYLQVGPDTGGPDTQTWSRMLSTFELQRLKNPQTPQDKQVLKNFPPDIQKQIKSYSGQPYIFAPLDPSRFYYAFYRKQSYEPLAVPMIFPLVNRLEYKMALERMDASLVQTMEQVFLLITAGDKRDEYNPGTNPKALANLQQMFESQAIGRVLVSTYDTKAEWKIPDLKELLGKGKYEQVDKDIREGLGVQFFGSEEKLANAIVKAKLFVKGLNEGRRTFLDNFLRPEIKKICVAMGFKNVPKVEFEEVDLEDDTAMNRVYVQMAQLGLLTDEELNTALTTRMLPSKPESVEHQTQYKKERDAELYKPLIGADKGVDEQGRPVGGRGKSMPNRKSAKAGFSMKAIVDNVGKMGLVHNAVEDAYRKRLKTKELTPAIAKLAESLAKSIVINEPQDQWMEAAKTWVNDPEQVKNIAPDIIADISQIAVEYEANPWNAIALYRSRVEVDE